MTPDDQRSEVDAVDDAVDAAPDQAYAPPQILDLGAVNTETLQTGIP